MYKMKTQTSYDINLNILKLHFSSRNKRKCKFNGDSPSFGSVSRGFLAFLLMHNLQLPMAYQDLQVHLISTDLPYSTLVKRYSSFSFHRHMFTEDQKLWQE